jgi:glucokinase
MKDVFVGIDVGGSHLEVGLVDSNGSVLDSRENSLKGSEITPSELIKQIKNHVSDMTKNPVSKGEKYNIVAAGIGCPGLVKGDTLLAASNFPKFEDVPFVKMLTDALNGVPSVLLNDADAMASAEIWGNPATYSQYQNLAMITLGTGIGSSLFLNGQIYQGSHGMIEAGHMIVDDSLKARPCGCGQKGCVEAYSSAKNTVIRLQEMDLEETTSSTVFTGKDVFARYQLNDSYAVQVVEEVCSFFSYCFDFILLL